MATAVAASLSTRRSTERASPRSAAVRLVSASRRVGSGTSWSIALDYKGHANSPDGVRVGTVDKFQGQQAPIVIVSMASSSAEDAPRGIDFAFDRHRVNVATSRAQCRVVLACAPALLDADCKTVEQMRLVNAVCRFTELVEARIPERA